MCNYLPLLQKLPAALVIRKVKVTKHSSRVSLREIFTWKGLKQLTEPLRNISGWVFSFKGLLLLRTTLCAFSSFGKGKITAHNVGTKIGLIGHIYFGIFCTGWWEPAMPLPGTAIQANNEKRSFVESIWLSFIMLLIYYLFNLLFITGASAPLCPPLSR